MPVVSPFWPRGVPRHLRVPEVTLVHYLDTAAQRYPDKPALVFAEREWTYREMAEDTRALAGFMQQRLGVKHGDRILLVSQNCPQFVLIYLAALRAGAAVVPVSPMSTLSECRYYAQDSGANVAFVAQDLLPQVQPLLAEGVQSVVVHAYSDWLSPKGVASLPEAMRYALTPLQDEGLFSLSAALAEAVEFVPVALSPDDLAVLPYTSGTTGHPKGCCHSHRTVLASNVASQVWRGLHADAVILGVAPLFHMLGMQNSLNMPLTLGATVVMLPRWDAVRAVELVERYRVTAWAAPPSMVMDFFAHAATRPCDLSSLVLLSGGGAAMPEAVAAMLQERFDLHYNEAYGLTETAAFLHANPVRRGKRQCLGLATQGVDTRIIDPETLQEMPVGEVGELVTRGPQLMRGYWQRDGAVGVGLQDGWFHSGDLGQRAEDGCITIVGRSKDMIISGGENIYPAEIENQLVTLPGVAESAVVGVADARWGEVPVAVLVCALDAAGQALSAEAVLAHLQSRIARFKLPRRVVFMDALPKSALGKVQKPQLQNQLTRTNP